MQPINIANTIKHKPQQIQFLFEGFKKRTVGFITAPGSTGKGFFTLQLAMSLADETEALNFLDLCNYERGKIGFLSAEDEEDILSNRIYNIGQYYINYGLTDETINSISNNLEVISLRGKGINLFGVNEMYNFEYNQEWIQWLTNFSKDKKLVIIDTLAKFHSADENNNAQMSNLLGIFERITNETNTSFLIVHHSNKNASSSKTLDETSSSRGASALIDNARYHITMNKLSDDEAEKEGIKREEKSFYAKVNFAKINYTKPINSILLKRQNGGVLDKYSIIEYKENKPSRLNITILDDEEEETEEEINKIEDMKQRGFNFDE